MTYDMFNTWVSFVQKVSDKDCSTGETEIYEGLEIPKNTNALNRRAARHTDDADASSASVL